MREYMVEKNIKFRESESILSFSKEADAIYMTRIQDEYEQEISAGKVRYEDFSLTKEVANTLKQHCIVLHPLPRRGEIQCGWGRAKQNVINQDS